MIDIHTFYFNPYRECTYIVTETDSNRCLIIDAGPYGDKEEQRLSDYIRQHELTPVALLITHAHPDHICGQEFIERTYNIHAIVFPADGPLTIEGWQTPITVLRTPGHKEDCVCYYFADEAILFSGDTLFQESIGRTDLPGGDMQTLLHSLESLKQLPDNTCVYPGHGYPTTIAHEKQYNPYL